MGRAVWHHAAETSTQTPYDRPTHCLYPTRCARAAATVVMLRDGTAGLEVFMVRRHGLSDVLGGTYVFPGGKVDPDDAQLQPHQHLDQDPELLRTSLGEPDQELNVLQATALYVAAARRGSF